MKKALSLILALIMCMSVMIVMPVTTTADAASKLATPKITKFQNTTAGVKISIGKVKGAVKYAVFAKLNKKWTKVGTTAAPSFVYKAAKSGKGYFFTVRCVAANGKTFTSDFNKKGWYSIYKDPSKKLDTPKITKLTSAASGVKITIGKVSGAPRYRVFVKSGSSWKVLGDTTTTTYTHKSAKVGSKYTYTVRCLTADSKSFISDYNHNGWSGTYNPTWNKLYRDFIVNEKYLLQSVNGGVDDYRYANDNDISFSLHDIDLNGTPELIACVSDREYHNRYVYSVVNQKIVLLGKVLDLPGSMEYIKNGAFSYKPNAKGLFSIAEGWLDDTATDAIYYYSISTESGMLQRKAIAYFSRIMDSEDIQINICDQKLYDLFNSAGKQPEEADCLRLIPAYYIKTVSAAAISSNGWGSFLRTFGFY